MNKTPILPHVTPNGLPFSVEGLTYETTDILSGTVAPLGFSSLTLSPFVFESMDQLTDILPSPMVEDVLAGLAPLAQAEADSWTHERSSLKLWLASR